MQSSTRGGAQVRLLVIHTTEGILRAADLRAWKAWPGSSHAAADQYGALLDGPGDGFVDYGKASWTLRSGNAVSDNIELCALAKWTRTDWLARPKLIEAAAVWLARRHRARPHIPLVKLTPAQVRAGMSGVIGHNDWTVGMKDGTHWDPGPGFPWDLVLKRANQLAAGQQLPPLPVEDDMPTPRELWEHQIATDDGTFSAEELLRRGYQHQNRVVPALVDALLDAPINRDDVDRGPTSLRSVLQWTDTNTDRVLTGLAEAASAAHAGESAEQVAAKVKAAVEGLDLRITVTGS